MDAEGDAGFRPISYGEFLWHRFWEFWNYHPDSRIYKFALEAGSFFVGPELVIFKIGGQFVALKPAIVGWLRAKGAFLGRGQQFEVFLHGPKVLKHFNPQQTKETFVEVTGVIAREITEHYVSLTNRLAKALDDAGFAGLVPYVSKGPGGLLEQDFVSGTPLGKLADDEVVDVMTWLRGPDKVIDKLLGRRPGSFDGINVGKYYFQIDGAGIMNNILKMPDGRYVWIDPFVVRYMPTGGRPASF